MRIIDRLNAKKLIMLYEVAMTIITISAVVITILEYFMQPDSFEVYLQ